MADLTDKKSHLVPLALDLLMVTHPDNPDAPKAMVREGCAMPLADALWQAGWRKADETTTPQTTTSAPGVAAPAESAPEPRTTASGASAPTSAEVVPERECRNCGKPIRLNGRVYVHATGSQDGKTTCRVNPYGSSHAEPNMVGPVVRGFHPGACPTCTYPNRETVNMVCQTCGWDYSRGEKL